MDAQTLIVILIVAWAGYVVFRRFFGRKSSGCGCGSGSCGSQGTGAKNLRDLNAERGAPQCGCGCGGHGRSD